MDDLEEFLCCDLFAGAGGASTGTYDAIAESGFRPNMTAVNHNPRAIETHELNHPLIRHFCEGIDDLNPNKILSRS